MAATSALSLTTALSIPSTPPSPKPKSFSRLPVALKTSFLGLPPPISRSRTPTNPPTAVLSMLPTARPDRPPLDKTPKWSASAIKSFGMGELEARKLKCPSTGTEALLMGILIEGLSEAAKFLRANGITLLKVREETVKLLGKPDMYFFSPEHPPLTESAQRALDWAVGEKVKSGVSGEVTASHILLGIWSEEDSAGHKIMVSLGFDNEKASELAKIAGVDAAMNRR